MFLTAAVRLQNVAEVYRSTATPLKDLSNKPIKSGLFFEIVPRPIARIALHSLGKFTRDFWKNAWGGSNRLGKRHVF